MSKAVSFAIGFTTGTAFGALGLCWLIEKHTAGIAWYRYGGCNVDSEE